MTKSTPKLIEIVCTANCGRSPVGEMIIRQNLRLLGALGPYNSISSGSHVTAIKNKQMPKDRMSSVIRMALDRGDIYSAGELSKVNLSLETNSDIGILEYSEKARLVFNAEEHEYRAEAIQYFSIEGELKKDQDQLIARPDVVLVLTMADSNIKVAKPTYAAAGFTPVIDLLGTYAHRSETPIHDAFGRPKQDYFKSIEMIVEAGRLSVNRFLDTVTWK